MGLAAAIIGGAASIGEGIFGAIGSSEEEKARLKALEFRMREVKDSTQSKTIAHMQSLNKTLADQAAVRAAGGGGGSDGPNMVSIGDINKFASDVNADKLNEAFQGLGIASEANADEDSARASEISDPFAGIVSAASSMSNLFTKVGGTDTGQTVSTHSQYADEGADDMQQDTPNASTNSPFAQEGADNNFPEV